MYFKNTNTNHIFYISDEQLQKRLAKDHDFVEINDPYKKEIKKTPVKKEGKK